MAPEQLAEKELWGEDNTVTTVYPPAAGETQGMAFISHWPVTLAGPVPTSEGALGCREGMSHGVAAGRGCTAVLISPSPGSPGGRSLPLSRAVLARTGLTALCPEVQGPPAQSGACQKHGVCTP